MGYIKTEISDGIGILSFNKPEVHNAFDDEAGNEWAEALKETKANKAIRVVVLRGEGKSFHAGRDVRAMGGSTERNHWEFLKEGQQSILNLLDMGKPTIAAVKGAAIGGGAEIALGCDIRISAPNLKMALPEVKYALAVDQGGSAMVTALAGPSRAKWLLMSGDTIDAQTALSWGLVDKVVELEELDNSALELARRIAANPYQSVLTTRDLVNVFWTDEVRAAVKREYINQIALYGSEDFLALRAKRHAAPEKKD